jgi:two-component system sensor histidine kinase KdpD
LAPLVFALSIVIVSYFTASYWPGIILSPIGIIISVYYFAEPYRSFSGASLYSALIKLCIFATLSFVIGYVTKNFRELERTRMEAEQEKLRANILRAVSHDIRTPLTSIVGASQAMLSEEITLTDESKKIMLRDMQEDAQWMIQMTENFLMATRMGAASPKPKHAEILEDMIGDVARKFRKIYPGVNLTVSIPPEIIFVTFDVILIKHVLMNMLENAVIHGNATHNRLTVDVLDTEVMFTLVNNGKPVDLALISSLLANDVTKYVEKGETGEKRSIGIGLTVCYSIIKAHGGELFVENIPETGACFRFTLPRGEEPVE